jgi:aquaporin Z
MKKYLIEFIGTFFLVLTIALTGNPIAIGFALTALVYMGGYISGAHYNPAVTLAMFLTKKIDQLNALKYIIAQLLGGFIAAGIFVFIHGSNFTPAIAANASWSSAFLLEVLFTFLLAHVVLNVAATDKTKGNDYFGLAIGMTVLVGAFAAGPISGGVFNPAVAVGPMLVDYGHIGTHLSNLIIYIIAQVIGAALAAAVYKLKFV